MARGKPNTKYMGEFKQKVIEDMRGNNLGYNETARKYGIKSKTQVKSELLYLMEFTSVEHFMAELVDYLDYYNHKLIKVKLKGLSPILYRTQALSSV